MINLPAQLRNWIRLEFETKLGNLESQITQYNSFLSMFCSETQLNPKQNKTDYVLLLRLFQSLFFS